MNLSEFKHWFEGFTDNLDGVPSKKAWEKIRAKIGEIKDAPATSYPVFIDRYRPYFYRDFYATWGGNSGGVGLATTTYQGLAQNAEQGPVTSNYVSFDSAEAFKSLGRAEALELTAA
jgi:hypothetical protein